MPTFRKRKGCMLAYPFEQARLEGTSRKSWNSWPVIVQPKLNGERCRPVDPFLLSSTEDIIYGVPHINECIAKLNPPFELDGELYVHGLPHEGPDGIHSIVSRTVNLHPNHQIMEYHLFDICDEDMVQLERIRELRRWFKKCVDPGMGLRLVPSYPAFSFLEVMELYEKILALGYEGIIVRHIENLYYRNRSTFMMKFKPKKWDIYEIIGFEEEHDKHGNPKDRLGTLIFTGDSGGTFSVYSGFDDHLREYLWSIRHTDLVGRKMKVYYQAISVHGNPLMGRVNSKELKTEWSLI